MRTIYTFIYLPGEIAAVPAGVFTHDERTKLGSFAYGRKYQKLSGAQAVDPVSLPLGLPTYPAARFHDGLYGAFRDASPDYWGRQVYAHRLKVPPERLSNLDFLLAANATRVGNLDFREQVDSAEPAYAPPDFAEMKNLLAAAEAVDRGGRIAVEHEALLELLVQGSSIGGARPKATVLYNGALWIAKFPEAKDSFSHAGVEFAAMRLAERCGIRTPEMSLTDVNGRDVFLSKRFDREQSENGFLRRGYISGLTLLDIDETDRAAWSYLSLADAMRSFAPPSDLKELFIRMVYNILIRNTDDHPRNHGFLHTDGQWRLSPAFDVVPARTSPGTGTDFSLTMTVGAMGREASIANALSGCGHFGLTDMEAKERIAAMCAQVLDWRAAFAACGVSGQEMEMFAWGLENEHSPLRQGLRI
jgi:serine/threonine-protein kinase HipA